MSSLELWRGTRSELQLLLADLGDDVELGPKMVFYLARGGRLFGKREDGTWAEYPATTTPTSSS